MRALRTALATCLAATLLGPGVGHAADPCAAPEDLTTGVVALPHVAAVLKPDATLDILTVGSATVFSPSESLVAGTVTGQALGLGTQRPTNEVAPAVESAFPLQMAAGLRAAVPGLTVNQTVRGGRAMTAAEMLGIIKSEVAAHHYQLVVWQTGTVEAVRNISTEEYSATLNEGADAIRDAGADLVLVDPQYSRFLHANAQIDLYEQAMQQTAARPGILLFPRYELMKYWVGENQIDLERAPRATRQKVVDQLHACIGSHLAHMVQAGAHLPPS